MEKFSVAGRIGVGAVLAGGLLFVLGAGFEATQGAEDAHEKTPRPFDQQIRSHALRLVEEGRQVFRFDTFGDEAFWGGMLRLHQAIAGAQFGGVGPGLSPQAALESVREV